MRSRPPRRRRRREDILRRLDRAAEWANPVLVAVALLLTVTDLSMFAAAKLSQLPIIRASARSAGPAIGYDPTAQR